MRRNFVPNSRNRTQQEQAHVDTLYTASILQAFEKAARNEGNTVTATMTDFASIDVDLGSSVSIPIEVSGYISNIEKYLEEIRSSVSAGCEFDMGTDNFTLKVVIPYQQTRSNFVSRGESKFCSKTVLLIIISILLLKIVLF